MYLSRVHQNDSRGETLNQLKEIPQITQSVSSNQIVKSSPIHRIPLSQLSSESYYQSPDQKNEICSQLDEEGLSQFQVASINTNDKFKPSTVFSIPINPSNSPFKPPSPTLCAETTTEFETPFGCSKTTPNLGLSQFFQDSPEAQSSPLPKSTKLTKKPSRLAVLQSPIGEEDSVTLSPLLPRTRKSKHKSDRLKAFDELRKSIALPTSDIDAVGYNEFDQQFHLGRCHSASNFVQEMDENDDSRLRPFSSAPLHCKEHPGLNSPVVDPLRNSLKLSSVAPQTISDSPLTLPDQKSNLPQRSGDVEISLVVKSPSPESDETIATPFMHRDIEIPGTVFETSPLYKAVDNTPSRVPSPKYCKVMSLTEIPCKSRVRGQSTIQSPTLCHNIPTFVALKRKQSKVDPAPQSISGVEYKEGCPNSEIRQLKKFRTVQVTVVKDSQNKKVLNTVNTEQNLLPTETDDKNTVKSPSCSETAIYSTGQALNHCNRVFALFKGQPPYYYPARVISPVSLWSKHKVKQLRVQFDDAFETTLDRLHIKRLELRPGDSVKVDMPGCRKTTFVVEKLGDCKNLTARRKDTGKLLDISVEKLYLTPSMFDKLDDRDFPIRTMCKSEDGEKSARLNTVPSSVSRVAYTSSESLVKPEKVSQLFSLVAFAITLSSHADHLRHSLRELIKLHSGIVLDSGFEELFFKQKEFGRHFGQGKGALSLLPEYRNLRFACVIADSYCRKVKYLQGLAFGFPCLSVRFIEDCISQNKVIGIEPYLLPAGESEYLGCIKSMIVNPVQFPLRACLAHQRGLLSGMSVAVMTLRNKDEGRKTYLFLSRAMGADMSFRITEFNTCQILNATNTSTLLVLVSPDERSKAEAVFGNYSRVVTLEWIVQSLIFGKLL